MLRDPMAICPTAEGFRVAFRWPSVTFAEVAWRWVVGATATALFFFGLLEYLDTLPVTNGELLFLRTRQPYLVWQAILHILHGSLKRAVLSLVLAAMFVAVLWMIAACLGRIATVRTLLEHFREDFARRLQSGVTGDTGAKTVAESISTNSIALLRLNFLRVVVAVALLVGLIGAGILASFFSPTKNPQPELVFVVFLPLAALVCFISWAFNWLLSLAATFTVRDREDVVGSLYAAVGFCRERTGAVFAVSVWTGLAHLVLFVIASTVASTLLGFAGLLPWRLVVLAVTLVTMGYFAIADWLYIARLAGYVCILEMPEALRIVLPPRPPARMAPPVQTSIDRDELIVSDVPGLVSEI